jgi:hypothetical protein
MRKSIKERFDQRISSEPSSGCWLWTGGTDKNGYGRMWVASRMVQAHRVAWSLYRGPIPDGYVVCHICDCPPCCNPEHLFVGTRQDNIADMVGKRRHPRRETAGMAVLTPTAVADIQARRLSAKDYASLYGVSARLVYYIWRGERWNDDPRPGRSKPSSCRPSRRPEIDAAYSATASAGVVQRQLNQITIS